MCYAEKSCALNLSILPPIFSTVFRKLAVSILDEYTYIHRCLTMDVYFLIAYLTNWSVIFNESPHLQNKGQLRSALHFPLKNL